MGRVRRAESWAAGRASGRGARAAGTIRYLAGRLAAAALSDLPPRLVADGLAMRFGRRRLFEGLSVSVEAGAPLAVVGANGSGKSTLLLVLAGLLAPAAGTVRLVAGGRDVRPEDRPQRVGLVSPGLQLYDALTARENLAFVARARRLAAGAVPEALARVGLLARADEPLATFSTGMRQRMRIAAAVMHRPPVLLLDEPGATLDEAGRALVAALVAETGAVVVVATNDPAEAALCPRRLTLGAAPMLAGPTRAATPR